MNDVWIVHGFSIGYKSGYLRRCFREQGCFTELSVAVPDKKKTE